MQKRSLSIKWKIFAYLVGFCALLMLILYLFQTVFLESFYRRIKLSQVQGEAVSITALAQQEDWDALYEKVMRRGDIYVQIWPNDQAMLVLPLPGPMFPEGLPAALPEMEMQLLYEETKAQGGQMVTTQMANFGGREHGRERIMCLQIMNIKGAERLLIVSSDISPVAATVQTLNVQLWYIIAIMLVLSTALAFLIAGGVSRPIEEINVSAKELGKGNYNAAFTQKGYKEIAELSQTLTGAAQQLSKTDALQKELIANVSHDLRTPLTLIIGYGEMMRDMPEENNAENMQVIIDEARRLTQLVSDLMDLSQLQAGVVKLSIEKLDMALLTQAILDRFRKFSGVEGFSIAFERQADAFALADRARISQVIYNFIINAITHTGEDAQVTLRQKVQEGRVFIEVSDSGAGIKSEDLPHIWERYYKVDKMHKRAATGAGLGLSIVKSILDTHPGVEYGVESVYGHGATFWFSLPICEE